MKVTAKVQRSGAWWAIEVPDVPGVFTQAKRLEQVPEMVADAVATMLETVDVEDVEVDVQPVLPDDISHAVAEAVELAQAAIAAQVAASMAMRRAAFSLREQANLSVRDAAVVLGVSHQRVSQLMETKADAVAAAKGMVGDQQERPVVSRGGRTRS